MSKGYAGALQLRSSINKVGFWAGLAYLWSAAPCARPALSIIRPPLWGFILQDIVCLIQYRQHFLQTGHDRLQIRVFHLEHSFVLLIHYTILPSLCPSTSSLLYLVWRSVFGCTSKLLPSCCLLRNQLPIYTIDAKGCISNIAVSVKQAFKRIAVLLMHGRSTARGCGLPPCPNLARYVPKGAVARLGPLVVVYRNRELKGKFYTTYDLMRASISSFQSK